MPAPDARQLAIDIARTAADQRAVDLVILDVRRMSPVTDYFVIGSGTSQRQMCSVFDAVKECAARYNDRPFGHAGYDTATWMLLDYVNVVFHLFAPKYREYYDLELLWGDAPRVDWSLSQTA